MASTFTWLDYSEHDRRKMLDVIELFSEKTTRDELGLGSVRDAFADQLFPGTSTIQTRAKYFLFVPWIYQQLERSRVPSVSVVVRARQLETKLLWALLESDDQQGLIGRRAKEKVQRLPSSVYWQGLCTWGLKCFLGSQDEYHKSLDAHYRRMTSALSRRSESDGEADHAQTANWHLGLPDAPSNFPTKATFALSYVEAEYLRERILASCERSLLAHLLRTRVSIADLDFAWQLELSDLPADLRETVVNGQNFSEVMHGSQLIYNLILAEQLKQEARVVDYRDKVSAWDKTLQARRAALAKADQQRFWQIVCRQNPRIHPNARAFIDQWRALVLDAPSPASLAANPIARRLVEQREEQLKRGLARVKSQRARELWSGAAGAAQLDLRWRSSRNILTDILKGLGAPSNA